MTLSRRQFIAAHGRQIQVAQQQIDLRRLARQRQRVGAIRGGEHTVADTAENNLDQPAERLAFIDEQGKESLRSTLPAIKSGLS